MPEDDGVPRGLPDGRRSKIRSCLGHVFALPKAGMGLFVTTIGIARATMKIGMTNPAAASPAVSGTRKKQRQHDRQAITCFKTGARDWRIGSQPLHRSFDAL